MWPWQDKKNNNNIIYSPCRFSLKNYNEKVINISCGSNFCIILNNNGQIYSMGKSNKYGELGLGDCNPRYHPSLITYFLNNNERTNQI
jgi:alpha-tubulin suppressor-like RCC1 family protein